MAQRPIQHAHIIGGDVAVSQAPSFSSRTPAESVLGNKTIEETLPPHFLFGQFADAPQDVVFTVEYSVRTAKMAVNALAGGGPPPPVYPGWRNPVALARALVESLR